MAVKPIPDGYHSVTSRLCISGAANAIEFYNRAYPATELMRFVQPDGKLGHAEVQIGDSIAMLSDEFPEMGVRSRLSLSGSPASIYPYVDDVDATFDQAIAAEAAPSQGTIPTVMFIESGAYVFQTRPHKIARAFFELSVLL